MEQKKSQRGIEVNRLKKSSTPDPNILYALATPYVNGALDQIVRYKAAAKTLKTNPVDSVMRCIHEMSCLSEDLATISKYSRLCGDSSTKDELWKDLRDHIRHDYREEFDNETNKNKQRRAARFNLDPKLQVQLSFKENEIKIGKTIITLKEIQEYVEWAASNINSVIEKARKEGRFRSS